jgi:hypothetical protein
MNVNAPIALIGARYSTPERALQDYDRVWGARHDGDFHHTSVAVLAKGPDEDLHVQRSNSTAKHLMWGGALLGSALVVVAPPAGLELFAAVGLSGAGAIVGHFRRNASPERLAETALLLQEGASGLVVVVVNRPCADVNPLLTRADERASVDMVWGDLEEELSRDFAHPVADLALVAM